MTHLSWIIYSFCVLFTRISLISSIIIRIPLELRNSDGNEDILEFSFNTENYSATSDIELLISDFCVVNYVSNEYCQLLADEVSKKISSTSENEQENTSENQYLNSKSNEDCYQRYSLNNSIACNICFSIDVMDRLGVMESRLLLQYSISSSTFELIENLNQFCIKYSISCSYCLDIWNHMKYFLINDKFHELEFKCNFDEHIPTKINEFAIQAELSNRKSNICINSDDFCDENITMRRISNLFQNLTHDDMINISNVAFVHSCYLPNSSLSILEDMLYQLSTKAVNLFSFIWVVNYGIEIPYQLQYKYPTFRFLQFSSDYSKFEIPTLQIIHHFCHLLNHYNASANILYMHTKGISYLEDYECIRDWRNMMMYFLVEKYQRCLNLLLSKEFDTIGTNLVINQKMIGNITKTFSYFAGNYWWATSSYISQLQKPISSMSKYDAELWLLSYGHPRVFVIYNSTIDHYRYVYPRSLYDGSDSTQNQPNIRYIGFIL